MKFLHTSDWHLGRSFHGYSTQKEQESFCESIINIVKEHNVDIVLIAGDIYDRAQPPIESIKLYEKTINGIIGAGAQIFMISGNHDNRVRLGTLRQLNAKAGLHAKTAVPEDISDPLIVEDEHGEIAIYGVPYIKPVTDQEALELEIVNPETAMKAALHLVETDLEKRGNPRSIVLAHAFVHGAEISDSEKHFAIGGIDNVPVSYFNNFDYVALGHLHGQQKVTEKMRYSGSPMPYSFSEAKQTKGFWLFDFSERGLADIEPIPSTNFRKLKIIKGSLEELLEDSEYADAENAWCQITVKQEEAPLRAYDKLKNRFPYLCELKMDIAKGKIEFIAPKLDAGEQENPAEVLEDFVEWVQAREPDAEEKGFIKEAVEEKTRKAEA
ncbi:MAG: exonuclease SbcCD subunit D C-terminal domain-containing protein [Micrococcaceae bacterium]